MIGFRKSHAQRLRVVFNDAEVDHFATQFVEHQRHGKAVGIVNLPGSQGLIEIASDAEIENEISITAHKAIGYKEEGRIVCFRKVLTGAV